MVYPQYHNGRWGTFNMLTIRSGKVIADRGVGLGKAWLADKNGFIHERSEVINDLSDVQKQLYGFLPRQNRRLRTLP